MCVLLWVLDFSACYRFKKQPWSLSYLLFLSSGELESVCIWILCCPHLHCPIKAKSESSATLVTTLDQISSLVKEIKVFSFSPKPLKKLSAREAEDIWEHQIICKEVLLKSTCCSNDSPGGDGCKVKLKRCCDCSSFCVLVEVWRGCAQAEKT